MFTYRIKHRSSPTAESSTHKEVILRNALARCQFVIGDHVRFKAKRGHYGVIVDIESHMDKITWTHGGLCPANITVDLDKGNGDIMRVKTSYKKLRAVNRC